MVFLFVVGSGGLEYGFCVANRKYLCVSSRIMCKIEIEVYRIIRELIG